MFDGYTSAGHAMSFADSPLRVLSLVVTRQPKEAVKRVSLSWNMACGAVSSEESQCVCREVYASF